LTITKNVVTTFTIILVWKQFCGKNPTSDYYKTVTYTRPLPDS